MPTLLEVASVLQSLDPQTQTAVLDYFPAAEREALQGLLVQPETRESESTRELEHELRRALRHFGGRKQAGEHDSARDLRDPNEYYDVVARETPVTIGSRPMVDPVDHFLENVEPERIAGVLRDEHPQIVAVLLGSWPPRDRERIERLLPNELRVALAPRLDPLPEVDAPLLMELRCELAQLLMPKSAAGTEGLPPFPPRTDYDRPPAQAVQHA